MSTNSLFIAGAAIAASCFLSAEPAHAQSALNPFTWFAPQPAYGAMPYCPNGNCGVAQTRYYQPVYANCPNGNCSTSSLCANGRCLPNAQGFCPNGNCALPYNGVRTPGYYAPVNPVYPTQPTLYNTYRPVSNGWTTSPVSVSRSINSANSPFYP